jgi:beta-xylosidase
MVRSALPSPTFDRPVQDALGQPLIRRGEADIRRTIDPCIFVDDDGQAYVYYGGAYKARRS